MKNEILNSLGRNSVCDFRNTLDVNFSPVSKQLTCIITAVKNLLDKAKIDMENLPNGSLRYVRKGNSVQFFRRRNSDDSTGLYIASDDIRMPQLLAQKKYLNQIIKACEKDLIHLRKAEETINNIKIERVASGRGLSDILSSLINPLVLSDEDYAKAWMSVKYAVYNKNGEPNFATPYGLMVRSKTEALILECLILLNIPFIYEPDLLLKDRTRFHPDFVILNLKDRSSIYIEHFGMMDDAGYREETLQKINHYAKNGITLGKNLIATFESAGTRFDQDAFLEILKGVLDLDLYKKLEIFEFGKK